MTLMATSLYFLHIRPHSQKMYYEPSGRTKQAILLQIKRYMCVPDHFRAGAWAKDFP